MAKRYIGNAVVRIAYHDDGTYRGTVSVDGGYVWRFGELRPAPVGFGPGVAYDSSAAYDSMAASAVGFGSYYTTHNRGDDCPDWAPTAEVADAIDGATSWDQNDSGQYAVRRRPTGPKRWVS